MNKDGSVSVTGYGLDDKEFHSQQQQELLF
jgi:hypothetical protein